MKPVEIARITLRFVSPTLYGMVSHYRNDHRLRKTWRKFLKHVGYRVVGGPFCGMTYVRKSAWGNPCPRILGCYELELHPYIEKFTQKSYRQVVDIGAAEGYYAVGLALRMPDAEVIAFDSDPEAQRLCAELAAMNNVAKRVESKGICTVDSLRAVLKDCALVICDCEGCEADLLDPAQISALGTCDLIVETHDFCRPGVSELIEHRFNKTHSIEWVLAMPRNPPDYPQLDFLRNNEARAIALNEMRPEGQRWGILQIRRDIQSVSTKER